MLATLQLCDCGQPDDVMKRLEFLPITLLTWLYYCHGCDTPLHDTTTFAPQPPQISATDEEATHIDGQKIPSHYGFKISLLDFRSPWVLHAAGRLPWPAACSWR